MLRNRVYITIKEQQKKYWYSAIAITDIRNELQSRDVSGPFVSRQHCLVKTVSLALSKYKQIELPNAYFFFHLPTDADVDFISKELRELKKKEFESINHGEGPLFKKLDHWQDYDDALTAFKDHYKYMRFSLLKRTSRAEMFDDNVTAIFEHHQVVVNPDEFGEKERNPFEHYIELKNRMIHE